MSSRTDICATEMCSFMLFFLSAVLHVQDCRTMTFHIIINLEMLSLKMESFNVFGKYL